MKENLHIVFSEHHIIEYIELGQVEVDDDTFTAIQHRCDDSKEWHLGLVAEPNIHDDGCDVEELNETTAIAILGKLFNVYIYDDRTGVTNQ